MISVRRETAVAGRRCFRGWWPIALAAMAGILLILMLRPLHDFLAVTKPVGHGILLVEAWLPPATLADVPNALKRGRYSHVLVVGAEQSSRAGQNSVEAALATLVKSGVTPSDIDALTVPAEKTRQVHRILTFSISLSRRTYACGEAVRQWTRASGVASTAVDVYTVGVHARKSWLLIQQAMGAEYRVGVIAGPETTYNSQRWVMPARGIRLVSRNLCGYFYARCWPFLNAARS